MPIPLIGAAIAGTMGVVSGRLIKKQIETHNEMEALKKKMNKSETRKIGGITGAGSKKVNPVYRNMTK